MATLVKAHATTISVSRSNPGGAAFANCILGVALAKLRKRYILSPTTPASGMKVLATNRGLA